MPKIVGIKPLTGVKCLTLWSFWSFSTVFGRESTNFRLVVGLRHRCKAATTHFDHNVSQCREKTTRFCLIFDTHPLYEYQKRQMSRKDNVAEVIRSSVSGRNETVPGI